MQCTLGTGQQGGSGSFPLLVSQQFLKLFFSDTSDGNLFSVIDYSEIQANKNYQIILTYCICFLTNAT